MTELLTADVLEALRAQANKPGRVFFFRAHAHALLDEVDQLRDHLSLAREFRIPCTNKTGGYAEIVVEQGNGGTGRWAVTDGSFTGKRAWLDDGWVTIYETGWAPVALHTLTEAIALARRVADVEGAAIDARVAKILAAGPARTVPTA